MTASAKASPRLRMNLDRRNSPEDGSQRMLNAIEPGSPEQIHRHKYTSETVVCLRGRLVEEFYDNLGRMCTDAIELSPNGPNVAINIPIGQWHTIRALESGTVLLECKDGKYEPWEDEDILRQRLASMTEDQLWIKKYQEVKAFIETNHRNPSRHNPEESFKYCNWLKHNKKLLNAGEMKEDRVALFENLLEMGKKYRRKNQYE